MPDRTYLAIDLKSFYASVECVARGLDPLTTNLVVADVSRTEKTICLAVSPSLKAHGIPGRARLFEVVQKVREVNAWRRTKAPGRQFTGKSSNAPELAAHPDWELDYIIAPPHMARYMAESARIYAVYLQYIAPEDIHSYSIDEVFIDATAYLPLYNLTAEEFARKLISEILQTTGITATAGIGSNLYLAKVAMDIQAKHVPPDANGVRMARLDEQSYRRNLWEHRPLTDFWRVGHGYAKKLEAHGLYTMGDIARCSLGGATDFYNEELLYNLFGVNAELLIDHAWGWEPCTMQDIKVYKPETTSIGSGQVLHCGADYARTRLIVREMADQLAMDLLEKGMMTKQLVLTIGYDIENLTDPARRAGYRGPITVDRYGRRVPKAAHGTANLAHYASSSRLILEAVTQLYERIMDKNLIAKRLNLTACNILSEDAAKERESYEQMDFFSISAAAQTQKAAEEKELERERKRQEALLAIRKKFGKNAILKGMDLQDGATTQQRNAQIGGHNA